jgi:ankyrin repeat domain-containing protein 50
MKHTLLYCQEEFKDHNIAFYFFNARGGPLEKCPLGMLRSLMVQLLEQYPSLQEQFIPHFLNKKIRHKESERGWETGELKEFLLREYKRRQCKDTLFLVDALDECNDPDVQEVMDFLEDLSENAKQSDSNLRICLSSRHYPYIDTKKKIELVVEQQAEHDQDIFKYVQSKLKVTNMDIQRRILKKAQHIFIWVVLVVELLNIEFTKGKIKAMWKKLNEIPSDLDELFSRLLEKEDSEDDKKTAILLFQWVLFSIQPLKPTELYFSVLAGTDPDDLGAWDPSQVEFETIKRFITSASRGLVQIVPDRGTVQFIHQSVIDFLTRNQRLVKMDPTLAPNAVGASHARLASCCMAYSMQEELRSLAMDVFSRVNSDEGVLDEVEVSYPLLKYTLKGLFAHAENAQAEGISQISLLRRPEKHGGYEILQSLRSNLARSHESFKGAQLLYVVSLQGCYYLVRALLLEHKADVNAQGGYFGTALQAVAYQGFIDIVVLLLDRGANVNAQGGFYGTALQAAADRSSTNIIALLLERGANVNAQGGFYGTALQAAAVAQDSTDTISLLLDHGANVNAQCGQFSTALQAAVAQGSTDAVSLLLDRGANINAQGGFYGTALQAAAAQGSTDTVSLLLNRGANVNAQGGFYGTALQAAVYWGFIDIATLLLAYGANINAQSGYGGTAP